MKILSMVLMTSVATACGKSKASFKDTNNIENLDSGNKVEEPLGDAPPGDNLDNDEVTPEVPREPGANDPLDEDGGDSGGSDEDGGDSGGSDDDKETPEPDGPFKFELFTINQSEYQDNCNNGLRKSGVNENSKVESVEISSDLYYLVNGNGNDVSIKIPANANIQKLCIWVNGGENNVDISTYGTVNELYMGINGEKSKIKLKLEDSSRVNKGYRHISGSKSDVTAAIKGNP